MRKRFLLCFHDFSVWNYPAVMPLLESICDLVGQPFSILVIPYTEGASEEAVTGFKNALSMLRDEGFELIPHGYKHKAEFSQGRSYSGLLAMKLTQNEAEFAGLSEPESNRLLKESINALKELVPEIQPAVFVPPTWYSNKFLSQQVRAQKMLYESRFALITKKGKKIISPVASFAGIPKRFEKVTLKFAKFFLKAPLCTPRIALHPTDFPRLQGPIRDLLRTAIRFRNVAQYKDIM
ncbi:MAG: DUF2334 domain-containing protein [Fibrobacter sp.]|nr:DUF2334 domain-containing protein [Fibrobacter sp.]